MANLAAFKEAMKMSDAVKEIFLETAEENGWLDDRFIDKKTVAIRLLSLGDSVEKIAIATGLTIETIEGLK